MGSPARQPVQVVIPMTFGAVEAAPPREVADDSCDGAWHSMHVSRPGIIGCEALAAGVDDSGG